MSRDWIQIVANVALILGLVLVGLQIKQNSDLLRTQLLYEESGRMVASEQAFYGEEVARVWTRSIENPKDLELEEIRIIDAYLYSVVEQWRATKMLAEQGLLDDETEWQFRVEAEAPYFLGHEYGRACWNVARTTNGMLSPDLVNVVDAALERDPDETMRYLMQPINALRTAEEVK